MAKSQIASEFLILLGIGLIISLATLALSEQSEEQIYALRAKQYAKLEADRLSSGINTVYLLGDGAVKNLSLPHSLKDGSNYMLAIYPESRIVLINYTVQGKEKLHTSTIITSNVTGIINISNRNIKLSNANGVVTIEG